MTSESIEQFQQGARMWQTIDHATEKWIAIGEIAGTTAISPNNVTLLCIS